MPALHLLVSNYSKPWCGGRPRTNTGESGYTGTPTPYNLSEGCCINIAEAPCDALFGAEAPGESTSSGLAGARLSDATWSPSWDGRGVGSFGLETSMLDSWGGSSSPALRVTLLAPDGTLETFA